MRKLTISTGRSRQDTRWKQKTVSWERLLEKLSSTHRTHETEAEYHTAPRDRQTEIKDIGGFVGGLVEGGKRKKGAVNTRSLITLDIDYGVEDLWDDITLYMGEAMCVYSTHSHTHKNPRLRLIIPLARDVNRDEYEALARAVAATIGIDLFDDSTYQPERLMFWPSTPKDGEFIFEKQDGEPLDPDTWLTTYYHDWKDSSQWPVSSRQATLVRHTVKQQADPESKPGIVGRFCRTYNIHEAIANFLPEIYEPTDSDPNRYTYLAGSTAGGLVVYDDKFAYSHHGTDPCGGQLCNAFDLVRLHLYGDLDEKSQAQDPTRKPSFRKMEELINDDEQVKAEDQAAREAKMKDDFADIDLSDMPEPKHQKKAKSPTPEKPKKEKDDKWFLKLDTDKTGNVKSSMSNIMLILENQKGLAGNIRHDDLVRLIVLKDNLPWRKITPEEGGPWWQNDDDANLQAFMEMRYGIVSKEKVLNGRAIIARKNHYHPIKQYLESLTWDGTARVETLFADYLGAEDTELNRAVSRKCLVAAIKRIMHPGCKYDYITVFRGPEGIGKSTLLSKLGGEWFNDSVTDLAGGKGMEQIQGAWIIEAAELQGVKRNEVEAVKAFVSSQVDSYRPAYGRTKEVMPRQCVFFSTTNESEFLRGNTGNRRFWIIKCSLGAYKSPFDITEYERGQIWAEALKFYNDGEDLFLPDYLEKQMRVIQNENNEIESDFRLGMIQEFLDKPLPVDWAGYDYNARTVYLADEDAQKKKGVNRRMKVCAAEIYKECFSGKIDSKATYNAKDINALMDKIPGWKKVGSLKIPGYGVQKGYRRIEEYEEDDL